MLMEQLFHPLGLNQKTHQGEHTIPFMESSRSTTSMSSAFLSQEEAIAAVVGLSTAHDVWLALENTFSHHSKARELRLKDDLQIMKRGTKPFVENVRVFKTLCDQIHAIGRLVEDTDKVYWFLRGLGTNFSIAQMALTSLPCFADLISKVESFELF